MSSRFLVFSWCLIMLGPTSALQAQSLFGNSGNNSGTAAGGLTSGSRGVQGQSTSGIDTSRALGTTNLNAADGSLSATVGQGGFVGGQNSGAFVGNRFAGQTAAQGTQPQFGNLQNSNRAQTRTSQNRSDRKAVRPRYQIAFNAPVIPQQELESVLTTTAINLPPLNSANQTVQISVDAAGVVVLRGTVETERERKLLESYVRMEPGVRGVSNLLDVGN